MSGKSEDKPPFELQNRMVELVKAKEDREDRKWSQRNIAEATGIAKSTIMRYMTNKITQYDAEILEKLLQFLDATPNQFFGFEDDEGEVIANHYQTFSQQTQQATAV